MSKHKTTTHNEKAKPRSMQRQPQNRLLTKDDTEKSYNDNDIRNSIPDFQPHRELGQHLDRAILRTAKEVDFFQLFFTGELIANICKHTNTYAWANITKKTFICRWKWSMDWSYAYWKEKVYFLVHLWGYSKCSYSRVVLEYQDLYHSSWAHEMLPLKRFKALLAIIHVLDPISEKEDDKLRKAKLLSIISKIVVWNYIKWIKT